MLRCLHWLKSVAKTKFNGEEKENEPAIRQQKGYRPIQKRGCNLDKSARLKKGQDHVGDFGLNLHFISNTYSLLFPVSLPPQQAHR